MELRQARKAGLLSADHLNASEVARGAADWRRYSDPHGLVVGATSAVATVADALARSCPNLSRLLKQPVADGPPLLAAAFAFFLRREIETNDELANGLLFDGLRQLSAAQARALGGIGATLHALGGRVETVLDTVEQLGGRFREVSGKLDHLSAQIAQLVGRNNVHSADFKPQLGVTINNESERMLARALLAEVRKLPPEMQRADDLSRIGDVLRAAGLFGEARQTYTDAAGRAIDPAGQATNHYKQYLAALEQKQWDQALAAVLRAAALDAGRFAPFPLQQYQPRRILGAGGFGTAFLCRDQFMGREVVVKSLYGADLHRGVEDVFAEAHVLLDLSHTHASIIGVRHCSYADVAAKARPYIVMDYFPGGSLGTFVEQRGTLGVDDLLTVALEIAAAMKAAHDRRVLHRDLKPDNVLVRKEGAVWRVCIIDFGLAVHTQAIQASTSRLAGERTIRGESAAGTAKYAPPEQMGNLSGVPLGPYSDVYAFGKLCMYGLFGTTEPKDRHWKTMPVARRARLKKLLEQCTDEDVDGRPESFAPVLKTLESIRGRRKKGEASDAATAQPTHQAGSGEKTVEAADRTQQHEGETKLVELLCGAYERTHGHPAPEDHAAAVRICNEFHIAAERANQVAKVVRDRWLNANSGG